MHGERTMRLLTIGEIARLTDTSVHRVQYVVRSREIQPAARAGNLRVFSSKDVQRIAEELGAVLPDLEADRG